MTVFQGAEGFSVEGDQGSGTPTVANGTHTSLVMQFLSKEHPVVTCALEAYDDPSSSLTLCFNEAENDSKLQMACVVRMLHRCMEESEVGRVRYNIQVV